MASNSTPKTLYKSWSYCPVCVLASNLTLQPSTIVQKGDRVWLVVECQQHGVRETLYCSNAEFFNKALSYTFEGKESQISDIEDLKKKIDYNRESTNLPLCMELPIFESGNFLTDEELSKRVKHYLSMYPSDRKFVLKILTRGIMDLEKLNSRVMFVRSLIPGYLLLLESSFERLALISQLQDSAFLCPNIYPALKYYLRKGDEELCKTELQQLFGVLKTFSGIQLMVTLCVNRPYPKMEKILDLLRIQHGFVRLVVISMERPPREMIECIGKGGSNIKLEEKLESGETLNSSESIDVYELLEHIQKSSYNTMTINDFFPVSLATAMEPLLSIMGYGSFQMRPSPLCGFATCLVNTKKSFASYPATRLFDIERIFHEIKPFIPKLQEGKLGILNGARLKKIIQSCAVPNKGPMPDLYDHLTDKSKSEETNKFIQNLQFVVVHNNMDMLAFDMTRRCQCIIGTWSASATNSVAAYCTGCI